MSRRSEPELFGFAEQLVDNPEQMDVYDEAKWNMLGHADLKERFAGHHPWPKRIDTFAHERVFSVLVFSGFSVETSSVLMVRKDPWTHSTDPESWLVAEQNLVTGRYVEPVLLRANIDTGRRLWLQIAPRNYRQWPAGKHPALHALPRDQIRIEGRLDEAWHLCELEYRDGMHKGICYEDVEALESMIIAVQAMRGMEYSQAYERTHRESVRQAIGMHSVALAA
jgi:hypothetical protein